MCGGEGGVEDLFIYLILILTIWCLLLFSLFLTCRNELETFNSFVLSVRIFLFNKGFANVLIIGENRD